MEKIKYWLVLLFSLTLIFIVTKYRSLVIELGALGYIGILVSCFLANSTVFLPAPSSVIVFTMASVFPPFWVALVGGLGASVGEIIGYASGYSGKQLLMKNQECDGTKNRNIQTYLNKYGMWAVFLFAFLPLPLFDLVGVTAGILKMNFIKFNIACFMGKLLKMLIYAFIGSGIINFIRPYLEPVFSELTINTSAIL